MRMLVEKGGLLRHLHEQYEERNRYRSLQWSRWKRAEFEPDDDGHPDQDNRVHTDWLASGIIRLPIDHLPKSSL